MKKVDVNGSSEKTYVTTYFLEPELTVTGSSSGSYGGNERDVAGEVRGTVKVYWTMGNAKDVANDTVPYIQYTKVTGSFTPNAGVTHKTNNLFADSRGIKLSNRAYGTESKTFTGLSGLNYTCQMPFSKLYDNDISIYHFRAIHNGTVTREGSSWDFKFTVYAGSSGEGYDVQ